MKKRSTPFTPFIPAINLVGLLSAMCMPNPVDVLFGNGEIDFDALPDSTPTWVPYSGQKTESLVRAMVATGHAVDGHVVSLISDKRSTMHQAVHLSVKGRKAVCEHERLMREGKKLEALEIAIGMFGFKDDIADPARAAIREGQRCASAEAP